MALAGDDCGALVTILHGNGNGTFQAPTTIGTTTDVVERRSPTTSTTTATPTWSRTWTVGLTDHPRQRRGRLPGADDHASPGHLGHHQGRRSHRRRLRRSASLAPCRQPAPSRGSTSATAPADSRRPPWSATRADRRRAGSRRPRQRWRSGSRVGTIRRRRRHPAERRLRQLRGADLLSPRCRSSQPIVADLNGDGRPDLALTVGDAFLGQSQVLVFLNTCDQPPADLAVTLNGPTATAC